MTSEEIDKYLNQIAFSSANDFLEKYKDQVNSIIGHFGLGFYSAFMVSDRVEVISKSWDETEPAVSELRRQPGIYDRGNGKKTRGT